MTVAAHFGVTTDDVQRRMAEKLRALDGDSPFPSALPPAFADVLAAVIAREEAEASSRAALLWSHYFDVMPRQRRAQLTSRDALHQALFHTPLDWAQLPRWRQMREGLFAALQHRALPVEGATFAALYARTYYGGCMPLLYGQPADLAHAARDLAAGAHAVLDRYFAAPLLHELAHLHRDTPALFPLYLDECVAGYVGVHAWPRFAYPDDGDVDAIYAAPWFAQVGQALARVTGMERLLDAHAGRVTWGDALPHDLATHLLRVGVDDYLRHRRPHLLADGFLPAPWLKLIFAGAAGELLTLDQATARSFATIPVGDESAFDLQIIGDALRAVSLSNTLVAGHFVVTPALPPRISVDLDECVVRAGRLAYLFPPATAARLRAQDVHALEVTLHERASTAGLAALSLRLSDGKSVTTREFSITRRM